MWKNRWIASVLLGPAAAACGNAGGDSRGDPRCSPLTDPAAMVEAYATAWNVADSEARGCLLEQSLTDDVGYVDPANTTRDRAALSGRIGEFLNTTPDTNIVLTGSPQVRNGDLRVTWDLLVSGATTLSGVDYMRISESGRVNAIWSYWGPFIAGDAIPSIMAYVAAWNVSDANARNQVLAEVLTDDAHLCDGTNDARGRAAIQELVTSMRAGSTAFTAVKLQSFGSPLTHARAELSVADESGTATTLTDYIRFDGGGKIEDIARFTETSRRDP